LSFYKSDFSTPALRSEKMSRHCTILPVAAFLILTSFCAAGQETQIQYLSGHGPEDAVQWEFFCTGGRKSGQWTTIPVPSCWEQQGFGTYNYGLDSTKHDPEKIPLADEQGKYKCKFSVPQDWSDKIVRTVFEGSMTDTEVFVNGKSAGPKHQGAFYRFKHDITELLNFGGDNLLEVTVSKRSSNASINLAERESDFWQFGGIFRPVYLEALPVQFIDWVAIDAKADGSFLVDVHPMNVAEADNVIGQIETIDGQPVGEQFKAQVQAGAEKATLQTQVSGHMLWTAETPNLYRVKLTLRKGDSEIHTVAERFGFRTFEVRAGDGLYLNGQKISLKGCDRHCFNPKTGRTISRKQSYGDAALIKEMNMNAVRMSHYPPDVHFLEACDELGLYVLDELTGWQKAYETEVGRKLVKELVTRDVCHPCVLFWDNGNEGGWNTELDGEYAKYDPQKRNVLHPWETFGDIDTKHYIGFDELRDRAKGTTLFMPTEFLHGLYDGGAGAGLDDFWNMMLSSPMCVGGFIWAFADEGVVRTDMDGFIDVKGNLAPDGIVGPYHQKEGSFHTIKEIWSPVYIGIEKLPPSFDGTLEIENRCDFTNLIECSFQWQTVRFAGPADKSAGHAAVSQGKAESPDVAPHTAGTLKLDLPNDWRNADALYLTAADKNGAQVWTWSWPLKKAAEYAKAHVIEGKGEFAITEASEKVSAENTVIKSSKSLTIANGNTLIKFSKEDGSLMSVTDSDSEFAFGNGPRMIQGFGEFESLSHRQDGEAYIVEVTYSRNLTKALWTIYPSGWLKLDCQYEMKGAFDVIGISFDYPEEKVKSARWLGAGPYRVWKNRLKGTRLDVWQRDYNESIPAVTWAYPEFKGYYADFNWAVLNTEQGDITLMTSTDDMYLALYRPPDGPVPARTALELEEHGIGFCQAIPPIGTKFSKPVHRGPQGAPNSGRGEYETTIYLKFDGKIIVKENQE
jgi:hypothetical protein